jgi:hypothetical protein
MVKNLWWLVAALALPLLGAAPSTFPPPVVVIYPLTQTSGVAAEEGSNIAILLATKITELGGVTVKPPTPGTERAKFLENALSQDADYYITGFLTPLGTEISMITQVVSTRSGSVVYSTSISAKTYADAEGQADLLHAAILRHAGRALAALDAPPPEPSGTPAPNPSAKGVDLTKALRHRSAAPAASASAAVAVAGAQPTAAPYRTAVVEIGGDFDAALRTPFGEDLSRAFAGRGFASGYLPVAESVVRAHAADLCAANAGTRALFASTVAIANASSKQPNLQLDVTAYDCSGTALGTQRAVATASGRGGLAAAFHRAALSAAAAFVKAGIPAKPAA